MHATASSEGATNDANVDRESEWNRKRKHATRLLRKPLTSDANPDPESMLHMGCWQAYARRIAILLARGNFPQAHRCLDAARDFRAKILRPTYGSKGESLECILPVDTSVIRQLWIRGFKSVESLRNETIESLMDEGLTGQQAGEVMGAVAEYFTFLYNSTHNRGLR